MRPFAYLSNLYSQASLPEAPILPQYVTVGRHTYGVTKNTFLYPTAKSPVHIGNFCSFAKNVRILCHANHPTDLPSSFPFRSLLTRRLIKPPVNDGYNFDATTKGPIDIGHDVWVGESAIILSGSVIGTGAVIGAGAVIRDAVPPYSVVIGNPQQIIRTRFPKYVDQMLASRWWDLPDTEIAALDDAFYQKDISLFLKRVAEAWKRCSSQFSA
ncbi:MAG: CatB-related O-acetyltransferase [Minisyncoccia bacterium]|jgi:acetyltransferase-like isoleucine patch superfamily enzyme